MNIVKLEKKIQFDNTNPNVYKQNIFHVNSTGKRKSVYAVLAHRRHLIV